MSQQNLTARLTRVNQGTDPGNDIVELVADGGGYRVAAGTGTMVAGAATVTTGLNAITGFTVMLKGTGNTSAGVTGTESMRIQTITTGAVTVGGLWHSNTASVSVNDVTGTNSFYWIAVGS